MNRFSPVKLAYGGAEGIIENDSVLPIPGAKNGNQAADNAAALTFKLTSDEIEALSQATLA